MDKRESRMFGQLLVGGHYAACQMTLMKNRKSWNAGQKHTEKAYLIKFICCEVMRRCGVDLLMKFLTLCFPLSGSRIYMRYVNIYTRVFALVECVSGGFINLSMIFHLTMLQMVAFIYSTSTFSIKRAADGQDFGPGLYLG